MTVTVTLAVGWATAPVPEPDDTPAAAVTFVVFDEIRIVRATPDESVSTTERLRVPASVVKVTGTPGRALPPESTTLAEIVDDPPLAGSDIGDALMTMPLTAAEPIAILSAPSVPAETPPEIAVIVAVPDAPPAMNFTRAWPLMSVSASAG